ncbi:MAG: trypsin-like peptidase domain-containing protein [Oligoflexia bacterium]|nr:trypsin-like peptidase domain-containing protein [Oligoflexia bacterium]
MLALVQAGLWVALLSVGLGAPADAHDWDPGAVADWSDSVVRLLIGSAVCSGVAIDDRGTIATAYHCVADRHRLLVQTRGGEQSVGKVLATDAKNDLALVRVDALAGQLPARPLRTAPLTPGLAVLAIGHPFGGRPFGDGLYAGTLSWSVSQGIISAVGGRLVQTDAALNPGTSGGPVLDAQGALVGIVSRKLGGEGVAFFVHVDRLAALIASPTGAHHLGGTYGLGLALPAPILASSARSVGLRAELSLRERLVVGVGVAFPLDARVQALAWGQSTFQSLDGSVALRQRLGNGPWSTTLDLGAGAWQLVDVTSQSQVEQGTSTSTSTGTTGTSTASDPAQPVSVWTVQRPRTLVPGLTGRLGMRSAGLRVSWLPQAQGGGPTGLWLFSAELDWPGVIGTF